MKDPLPPRTPLSRSKREKAKAARASWRDEVDGRPEVAIKPEDEDREAVGLETRPRQVFRKPTFPTSTSDCSI